MSLALASGLITCASPSSVAEKASGADTTGTSLVPVMVKDALAAVVTMPSLTP